MRRLVLTYITLVALLAAAVAVPYLHLGAVASYAIACVKMLLILTVFMKILRGSHLYLVSFALGFLFLCLLVTGSALDLLAR